MVEAALEGSTHSVPSLHGHGTCYSQEGAAGVPSLVCGHHGFPWKAKEDPGTPAVPLSSHLLLSEYLPVPCVLLVGFCRVAMFVPRVESDFVHGINVLVILRHGLPCGG